MNSDVPTPRHWFDATTLLRMRGYGPVGLTRVEANVVRAAYELPETQVGFCRFNRYMRTVVPVDRTKIAEVLAGYGSNTLVHRARAGRKKPGLLKQAGKSVERGCRRLIRTPIDQARHRFSADSRPVSFQPGDSFIVSGSTWDALDPAWLENICGSGGVKLVAVLADMIPWRFPHQFHDPAPVESFLKFAEILARHAELVACISRATQVDFLEFAQGLGCADVNSEVMILGTDPPGEMARPDGLPDDFTARGYVLSVSTIQVRKNHQLLYHLWRRFAEEGRTDVPRLVLVGSRGWLSDDLLYQIKNDPLVRDSILVLNHVGDAGLNWLYRHCRFTLYPSFYEGWGLPIVESLQHGKACIASRTSSMPEAGQGLALLIDPLDFEAWHCEILNWIENPAALRFVEEAIRCRFRPRTWTDFTQQLIGRVLGSCPADSQRKAA